MRPPRSSKLVPAAQVTSQTEGWPPGTWVATLADPDGNYFQLVSPM